jgi:hypothetical protein
MKDLYKFSTFILCESLIYVIIFLAIILFLLFLPIMLIFDIVYNMIIYLIDIVVNYYQSSFREMLLEKIK